jgi:hypothetical protein
MKIITVKSCGECPNIREASTKGWSFCFANSKIFMRDRELGIININCPLSEDTWKARCEQLMGLIDSIECVVHDSEIHELVKVKQEAKKIMEGKV